MCYWKYSHIYSSEARLFQSRPHWIFKLLHACVIDYCFFLNCAIESYELFNPKCTHKFAFTVCRNAKGPFCTSISKDLMHPDDQIGSGCRTSQTVSHLILSVYTEAEFDQVSSKQLNNSVQWQPYFTWLVHLSWLWI